MLSISNLKIDKIDNVTKKGNFIKNKGIVKRLIYDKTESRFIIIINHKTYVVDENKDIFQDCDHIYSTNNNTFYVKTQSVINKFTWEQYLKVRVHWNIFFENMKLRGCIKDNLFVINNVDDINKQYDYFIKTICIIKDDFCKVVEKKTNKGKRYGR